MSNNNLDVYRVPFGKDDVPLADREYRIRGGSPVGSAQEFMSYVEDQTRFTGINFWKNSGSVDNSGVNMEQQWEIKNGEWVKTK